MISILQDKPRAGFIVRILNRIKRKVENPYRQRARRDLLFKLLKRQHGVCALCKRSHGENGKKLEMSFAIIKSRAKYPALRPDIDNVHVVCKTCKGFGERT